MGADLRRFLPRSSQRATAESAPQVSRGRPPCRTSCRGDRRPNRHSGLSEGRHRREERIRCEQDSGFHCFTPLGLVFAPGCLWLGNLDWRALLRSAAALPSALVILRIGITLLGSLIQTMLGVEVVVCGLGAAGCDCDGFVCAKPLGYAQGGRSQDD